MEAMEKSGKEYFVVDDLLDFSNEDVEEEEEVAVESEAFESVVAGSSMDSSTLTAVESCNSSNSGGDKLSSRGFPDDGLADDLCEPYDELAELEWLSNFVEESFSNEDLHHLHLISTSSSSSSLESQGENTTTTPTSAVVAVEQEVPPVFLPSEAPVRGKARSKRSRTAPCDWSSRLLVLSPPNTYSESELLVPLKPAKKVSKPSKKKREMPEKPKVAAAADGRRCLHCATDKTPQWRTGPMGPKTLCNACGVRYKSGRLVPEYRPAASPTFVLSKHSNSHRKVLELRRQKEMEHHQLLKLGVGCDEMAAAAAAGDEFLIHQRVGPDFRQLV